MHRPKSARYNLRPEKLWLQFNILTSILFVFVKSLIFSSSANIMLYKYHTRQVICDRILKSKNLFRKLYCNRSWFHDKIWR